MAERIPHDKPSHGVTPHKKRVRIFKPDEKAPLDKAWRVARLDGEVSEALADLRDLCFRPPVDPNEEHKADRGCNSATAGLTMFALEALYDHDTMEKAKVSFQFNDGADVVKKALGGLFAMQENPDRHLYTPTHKDDTPPRNPNIGLGTVATRLLNALERDFGPEIQEIRAELAERHPT